MVIAQNWSRGADLNSEHFRGVENARTRGLQRMPKVPHKKKYEIELNSIEFNLKNSIALKKSCRAVV